MQRKNEQQLNLKRNYHKKQIIIVLAILLCATSFVIVFGRYVTESINNFFVRSKEFYFFSDKLAERGATFQVENWSGVEDYTITVNMNSRKNNIKAATYDIGYDIKYKCSDNAICQLSKNSGIIDKDSNTDFFNLIITPNTQLGTGDRVTVDIEVTSNTGYIKTLKGKFTLVVGQENLTYQITDAPDKPYMELRVTNTLPYYIVDQAFGSYTVGQKIDIDEYLKLVDEDRAKCHSAIVTVGFDPKDVLIDNTNENYQKVTDIKNTLIDGVTYINGFALAIDAISSADLRFYKTDTSRDYTYPNLENYSVVMITSE